MALVMQGVFEKQGFKTFGFDVVDVVMGHDQVQERATALLHAIKQVLGSDSLGTSSQAGSLHASADARLRARCVRACQIERSLVC